MSALLGVIMGQGNLDIDANTLMMRFSTQPSLTVRAAINTAIKSLKTSGIWALIDTLYVPTDAQSSQAGLLDWKRASKSATANGSAAWSATNGFDGSSVAGSGFDPSFVPSTDAVNYTVNDASLFFYVLTQNTNNGYLTGRGGGTATKLTSVLSASDRALTIQVNGGASLASPAGAGAAGFHFVQRTGGTLYHYRNGSSIASGASTASAIPTEALWVCSGISGGTPSDANIGLWGAGAPMNTTQQNDFKSIIDTYWASI